MSKPRLLFAVTSPLSGVFFRGQLAWLREQGFEVHFTCTPGQPAQDIVAEQQVCFHPIRMERGISPIKDIISLWRLIVLIGQVRPHIVNAGTPKAGLLVILASVFCRVPIRIYSVHGLRFETFSGVAKLFFILIERAVCGMATHVLCMSNGIKKSIIQYGFCRKGKMSVPAYGSVNGLAMDAYKRSQWELAAITLRKQCNIPLNVPVIGFIGRLVRDKGVKELLEAWKVLRQRHQNIHLLIVGEREKANSISKEDDYMLHSDNRIHMVGYLREVRPAYAAMQILVLPSYREGFGMVLLEAGAMENAVVASDIPACRDLVRHGETGMLVPVHDVSKLVNEIERYLMDMDLLQNHGIAARNYVREKFSHEIVWSWYKKFYLNILNKNSVVF